MLHLKQYNLFLPISLPYDKFRYQASIRFELWIKIKINLFRKKNDFTIFGSKNLLGPKDFWIKILVSEIVYVSQAYIPNLEPLGPPHHVEKFVVGGWVVGSVWVVSGCVKQF